MSRTTGGARSKACARNSPSCSRSAGSTRQAPFAAAGDAMPTNLIPPDPKRCQAEKSIGGPFSFGPPGTTRCVKPPTVIVSEMKPGKDGLCGSMSLCDGCLVLLAQQVGLADYKVESLPKKRGRG